GDRVAVAMDRSTPAAVILHLATLAAGATSVPLAPDAGSSVTGTVAGVLRPVCWLEPGETLWQEIWQEICSQASDTALPRVDPDAVALILCTSGTAGEPKCVKLTHRATAAAADQINRFTGLAAVDREILTLPLHHSFGLGRLRCLLVAGATGFVQPGVFRAERLLSAIRREQATVFAQVPAGFRLILAYGERARSYAASIGMIEIGSAALTVAEREQVMALFPQAKICHHFGLTEASRSIFCEYRDLAGRGKLDSLGRPAPGVDVALDEPRQIGDRVEGILKVRGPHVCAGYANPSLAGEHASAEGWWRTGDRVQIDRDGFLYSVGRQSDLIDLGGYKVAPEEIENQLLQIAGVRDAAVVGWPDPAMPAMPATAALVAFIQPADPLHPPAAADLQRHLYRVLESYKVPSHFRFVAALTRTENGKIRRAALLQELGSLDVPRTIPRAT
ncbi:MAG TPA: class I adenylate-forming enzyme family protein, partial [Thermoanaerobaculia bacterium]|nr:class I adenylate-forming enzyme family protein [Thermoanaerobaculia bacterium]